MSRSEFIALPLAELCNDMFSGGTPSTSNSGFWNGSYKWLSSGETRNNFIYDTEKTITDEAINKSSTKLARAKDIVMASAGQGKTRGQTSLLMTDTYINQSIIAIRPNEKIHYKYLYYYLKSKYEELRVASDGSSIRGSITTKDLKDFIIELPSSRTHQMKIAQVLFSYDNLIENNNRRIAILEEMAQRLYREWFVHFRFPGHEDVKMVESELGLIPEGWRIVSFSEIADFINGYAFKPSDWQETGRPIIKIAELKNGITETTPYYNSVLPEKYAISNGDILFSWSADLNAYIWSGGNGWLNQHLFKCISKEKRSKYILFFSLLEKMPEFYDKTTGSTMKHIKRGELDIVKTIDPAMSIQKDFDASITPVINEMICLSQQNTNLRKTRDHLLPRLISGDIDVSDLPIKTKED